MTRRVAIIGGGISGLSAAYRLLQSEGRTPMEVMLFEAAERIGGVIQTDNSQGVVLEGGPDSFLRRKPEAEKLARELGLGSYLIGQNPQFRGAYIFHGGRFHEIPRGVQAGIPTDVASLRQSPLLNRVEKMRLMGDFVLPRQRITEDIGLGQLLRYRLGDAYVKRIAAPILAGIYAGDIDQLSARVTAPQLLTYQSRARSLIQEGQKTALKAAHNVAQPLGGGLFLTLNQGMGSLVKALERSLVDRVAIHKNTPILSIEHHQGVYQLVDSNQQRYEATDVIVAVPSYRAAEMLGFLEESCRNILSGIAYADLAVVGAVYHPEAFNRSLDKTGFLIPAGEGVGMTAGTWVKSKWAYADESPLVPIRGFYGRAGERGLLAQSDDSILAQFGREMGYIMGVTDMPQYQRVFRIPAGMPQYWIGHHSRIHALRRHLQTFRGLRLIGAYFDGVGVPDCIRNANQAVESLTEEWQQSRRVMPL